MDIIKQVLSSFSGSIPSDTRTAAAIARGASPEEISECAAEEGLNALAAALFEACQNEPRQGTDSPGLSDSSLADRLKEYRQNLPADCETARLIDAGARLEDISEAAQQEGLASLVAMLVEAEQERA
ncbi:MAG: hypothetical protein ACK4FP_05290 [Azonexus sp.]